MVKQLKSKPKGLFLLPIILMITICVFMNMVSALEPYYWEQVEDSSFDTSPIRDIATDGTMWVAVGDDGKLATATDPTGTWTQRTSSFGSTNIFGIATDGTTWVAVGYDGKLATATDPTGTWTQRTSSFGSTIIRKVITDGTTWVAVGYDGKLATATDPTGTWTQRTSSFGSTGIYGITTDGATWVAVGYDGKLATATDPTGIWIQRTSSFGSTNINGVTTDGATWVAVGEDGKLATATDPTGTWTQRTSSFGSANIFGIATDGTTWVAVGYDGKLATAIDPTSTWVQRTSSFGSTAIWEVLNYSNRWIIVGYNGEIATNRDTIEVAHYTFNETSGTTLIDIAGNNDGINNGATINQTGKINKAYSFDGVDDYINFNPRLDFVEGTLSYSTWIKTTNALDKQILFNDWYTNNRNIILYFSELSDGKITLISGSDTGESQKVYSSTSLSSNVWQHIVYVRKGSNIKLYLNNSKVADTTITYTGMQTTINQQIGMYSTSGSPFSGLMDDTRIYDFELSVNDITLIYNNGYGTETPLDKLRSPAQSTIANPSSTVYPTISYDWNGSFIDSDYNSDYTYKYSFGFNSTNSFNGNEKYIDTNLTLNYNQNTIKYFDLDYTPTTEEIGDINYSFFRVYRYLNGNYDSNYVSWSSDTFTVLENIVFDFNAPEYPDWANLFYPTKNYSGLAHYQDKSFQSGVTTYKYDLGSNETNSLDGNQEYWKTNIDIASTDGNINAYFEHTLSVADKGKTLYAFLTMKRYHNGVFMDSNTEWTNSFDVNYGKFKAQFYDENCGCTLDGNVHLQNSINIPVDENGTVDIWLDQYITTDGEAIDTEVWREVAGVITHTKRKFDYYLYLTRSYDLNVSLLPIDIGANIQFLTKDIDNTLWANKYLMFVKGITDICPQDQQLISTYISETGVSTNKRGIRFSVNKDFYISTFKIEQGTNPVDSWELWNYTLGILIDSGTGLNSTTTTIDTSIPIKFDTNYEYSIVLFNEGGSAKFPYKSSQFTTPINTEYIEYTNGCDNGALACTSNNAYIITDISIMDANNYESFFDNPISEVKKLDSEGKGIFYLMADGNYSAILIDNIGTIIRQYQKTTVNLKKPKDEITGASISPYDVDVGGLLVYSLSNQTATDLNFNIFAGSTGYYDFTVVDYNANPTDRSYIPRKYAVRIPFGIEYTSNYNLQPYLITDVDGIIPQIKVIDQLNRAINDSVVIVYKYINGKYSVVESAITDSTGSMSWSAYPLDSYTIAVYYNEELKGTYILRPRTSDDVYYIKIELSADDELSIPDIFRINWGNTKEFYNVSSVNVTLDDVIISNSKSDITNYTVLLYQGNTLIDSDSNIVDNVNTITINHEFDCTTINKEYSNATIKIIVEYNNGLIKKFTRIVSISGRNVDPLTYFRGASEDLGQPLSAIISIFITALIIAMLSFSGLPLGKSGVALFGMFVLTVFVWFGWLDSGVTVLGFDVSRFMYVLVAIAIAYFTFKESVR